MSSTDFFLRLLSIDDETAPALTTDLIYIVKVADGEGGEADHISHWLQHVHLLGAEETIDFDLLFIDIRFHEDPYSPTYGDGEVNPLGLLHALTFAARQDPTGPPFVWGYHSGDPDSIKKDPIAIIVFSLLSALEQRGAADDVKVGGKPWKWNDVGIHNTPAEDLKEQARRHYSRALASLPKGGAEIIWQSMVRRYRDKFLTFVDEEKMFLDQDQVGLLLHAARTKDEACRTTLAEAVLQISGPPAQCWSRQILLQSLFADELNMKCDIWPENKLKELTAFLTAFEKMGVSGGTEFWYSKVKKIMKLVDSKKRLLKDIPFRERRCLGALAVLCWWLQQKSSGTLQSATVKSLLEAFGYSSTDPNVVLGCLQALSHVSIKQFMEYLETTNDRLPSPYHSVGLQWWINECGQDASKAPQCIRRPKCYGGSN